MSRDFVVDTTFTQRPSAASTGLPGTTRRTRRNRPWLGATHSNMALCWYLALQKWHRAVQRDAARNISAGRTGVYRPAHAHRRAGAYWPRAESVRTREHRWRVERPEFIIYLGSAA